MRAKARNGFEFEDMLVIGAAPTARCRARPTGCRRRGLALPGRRGLIVANVVTSPRQINYRGDRHNQAVRRRTLGEKRCWGAFD